MKNTHWTATAEGFPQKEGLCAVVMKKMRHGKHNQKPKGAILYWKNGHFLGIHGVHPYVTHWTPFEFPEGLE